MGVSVHPQKTKQFLAASPLCRWEFRLTSLQSLWRSSQLLFQLSWWCTSADLLQTNFNVVTHPLNQYTPPEGKDIISSSTLASTRVPGHLYIASPVGLCPSLGAPSGYMPLLRCSAPANTGDHALWHPTSVGAESLAIKQSQTTRFSQAGASQHQQQTGTAASRTACIHPTHHSACSHPMAVLLETHLNSKWRPAQAAASPASPHTPGRPLLPCYKPPQTPLSHVPHNSHIAALTKKISTRSFYSF